MNLTRWLQAFLTVSVFTAAWQRLKAMRIPKWKERLAQISMTIVALALLFRLLWLALFKE